jgi:hypothetical protein
MIEGDLPGGIDADDESKTARFFAEVEEHIAESGFHLTYVFSQPPLCYSVGFTQTWAHPELLLFGLGFDDAKTILIELASQVEGGERFTHGRADHEIFEQSIAFVEIPQDEYPGRFIVTIAVYGDMQFRALQVVTPDAAGRFPWHSDCDPDVVGAQPILGVPPAILG